MAIGDVPGKELPMTRDTHVEEDFPSHLGSQEHFGFKEKGSAILPPSTPHPLLQPYINKTSFKFKLNNGQLV